MFIFSFGEKLRGPLSPSLSSGISIRITEKTFPGEKGGGRNSLRGCETLFRLAMETAPWRGKREWGEKKGGHCYYSNEIPRENSNWGNELWPKTFQLRNYGTRIIRWSTQFVTDCPSVYPPYNFRRCVPSPPPLLSLTLNVNFGKRSLATYRVSLSCNFKIGWIHGNENLRGCVYK